MQLINNLFKQESKYLKNHHNFLIYLMKLIYLLFLFFIYLFNVRYSELNMPRVLTISLTKNDDRSIYLVTRNDSRISILKVHRYHPDRHLLCRFRSLHITCRKLFCTMVETEFFASNLPSISPAIPPLAEYQLSMHY
jgi:hypothetical protein